MILLFGIISMGYDKFFEWNLCIIKDSNRIIKAVLNKILTYKKEKPQ